MSDKLIIGSVEECDLPELNIENLQVRIDTGAKTSSIHADNVEVFSHNGKPWVRFDIHPDAYNIDKVSHCECALHDVRSIKSSNGIAEQRYVIRTPLVLAGHSWPIEITLTNRADMNFLMLLGREGMADRVLVDPSQTFLLTDDSAI
jgi:hypothetical protein